VASRGRASCQRRPHLLLVSRRVRAGSVIERESIWECLLAAQLLCKKHLCTFSFASTRDGCRWGVTGLVSLALIGLFFAYEVI